MIKMAGESKLKMSYRLCIENQIFNKNKSKKTRMGWSYEWWWDHKESISGKTRWKKESRKTKIEVVGRYWEWSEHDGCQEMEEESRRQICMGILKEVLVKLLGPYANKEDVLVLHLLTYNILIIDCETVSKIQRNRILCFKIFGISAPPATVRCEIGWPQNS